jgi:hypothetical protein
MVSYMYQYENGVKRRNVGYARIEAKSGQVKITIHMQLLGQLDSIFPTYLIQRDGNGVNLIYLGDTVLKNQIMDSKLTAEENNVMNTGNKLSEMGGLLLFMHDNIFFASEWDDKPIVAKELLDALKPRTHGPKVVATPEQENRKEEIHEDLTAADIAATRIEPVEPESLSPEGLSLAEEISMPKYKLPRGWKTIERQQKPAAAEITMEPTLYEAQPEQFTSEPGAEEQLLEAAVLNGDQLEQESTEKAENLVAKHLFDIYPRIYPFEDNEILLCVKIEPKDIGMLPKDLWALSNNSFLMHGFYCYHHLIFAKLKDRCGSRYILGIPGIYHSRERFMARMFGFESFKSIRRRELQQGDFGYWYLDVNF